MDDNIRSILATIDKIKTSTKCDNEIASASHAILQFLADSLTLASHLSLEVISRVFVDLVDVAFLISVFNFRRDLRRTSSGNLQFFAKSIIVSWPDKLMAQLGLLVVLISGGPASHMLDISHQSWSQQDEEVVLAATQLPEQWQTLPSLITSNHASPYAKRLAVSLLFGAYILAPQLRNRNPEPGCIPVENLADFLFFNMTNGPLNGLAVDWPSARPSVQEQVSNAMVMCLLSTNVVEQVDLITRPRTFAHLLDMMQGIIDETHTLSWRAFHNLTIPVVILLKWGNIVPWCWSMWSDQRYANVEYLTILTMLWLLHLESLIFQKEGIEFPTIHYFETRLLEHQSQITLAMLQVFGRCMDYLKDMSTTEGHIPRDSILAILNNACLILKWVLKLNLVVSIPDMQTRAPEICRCLSYLFLLLGDTDAELRIRCLSLENITLTRATYLSPSANNAEDASLTNKTRQAITKTITHLINVQDSNLGVDTKLLSVKLLLDFHTIFCRSREGFRGMALELLGSVVKILRGPLPCPFILRELQGSVIAAASILSEGGDSVLSISQAQYAWDSATNASLADFTAASSLAYFIIESQKLRDDTLRHIEAWDYLRDVLFSIIRHRLVHHDEYMGLLICPLICRALSTLLRVGTHASKYIASSPWTRSLGAELGQVLGTDDASDPYMDVLRRRIGKTGAFLLEDINCTIAGRAFKEDCEREERVSSKLIFTCDYPTRGIVLCALE